MNFTPATQDILGQLRSLANQETLASQSRFGIAGREMLGVSIYDLRKIAKGIPGMPAPVPISIILQERGKL